MIKQILFIAATLVTLTPSLAKADAFTKAPAGIDFNQMINDSDIEVKDLSAQIARRPDAAPVADQNEVEPALGDFDTASN